MKKEKQVLVIFPHPDDEAFGVSGTIAMHAGNGTPVTYICCTLGEMGRNMGNPPFANRETLPLIRKKELEASCKAIGINDLKMFGLRDKTLEFEDPEELAERFMSVMIDIEPSLMITFYPGYSVHPDHDACGAAAIRAVEKLPKEKRPVVHCVAFSNNCEDEIGKPDIFHDVSEAAEQKIAAIRAHKSQFGAFMQGRASKLGLEDEKVQKRIKHERFWTYPFD